MKTKFFTIVVLLALALSVFVPSNASLAQSENVCPEAGGLVKIDVNEGGGYTIKYLEGDFPVGFEFEISGYTVTFSQPVDICVKAGNEWQMIYGVMVYEVQWTNTGGQTPDISHIVIYEFYDVYEGQWCSPGYWRNHLDEVPVELDSYYGGFMVSDILENPKIHARTGLFEGLADYLSGLHDGVDYLGVRVEDSCPLD